MNCRSFQDRLYEYVEGSLSTDAQAAAERHLAGCSACRQAVQAERQLAQFMSSRLQESAKALTLRPDIRSRILAAAESQSTTPTVRESMAGLWIRLFRLTAIPVCLLLVIAVLWIAHSPGTRMYHTEPLSSIDPGLRPAVSIQISYHEPTCKFHQEGNLVIDSLSDKTVVASGVLQPGARNLPR